MVAGRVSSPEIVAIYHKVSLYGVRQSCNVLPIMTSEIIWQVSIDKKINEIKVTATAMNNPWVSWKSYVDFQSVMTLKGISLMGFCFKDKLKSALL